MRCVREPQIPAVRPPTPAGTEPLTLRELTPQAPANLESHSPTCSPLDAILNTVVDPALVPVWGQAGPASWGSSQVAPRLPAPCPQRPSLRHPRPCALSLSLGGWTPPSSLLRCGQAKVLSAPSEPTLSLEVFRFHTPPTPPHPAFIWKNSCGWTSLNVTSPRKPSCVPAPSSLD